MAHQVAMWATRRRHALRGIITHPTGARWRPNLERTEGGSRRGRADRVGAGWRTTTARAKGSWNSRPTALSTRCR